MSAKSYTLGKILGRGSFGKVYETTDQDGNRNAVKVISISKSKGLTSLLELSILRTYNHDCVNNAFGINSDNDYTYIAQGLADSDLEDKIKLGTPSHKVLRTWCQRIAQGIYCLHEQGIIHCDMKPSNCLLFGDNVKITDFTLSVWKISSDDIFNHSICTLPYRPPEVLRRNDWSNPVDIWSLGCTFYALATGKLLIPYQGSKLEKHKLNSRTSQILKDKTLAAILDWRLSLGDPMAQKYADNDAKKKLVGEGEYQKVTMDEKWFGLSSELRELILCMTNFDPRERPTIKQVLQHPYFKGMHIYPTIINSTSATPLNDATVRHIERIIGNNDNLLPAVVKLTKEILGRCYNMLGDASGRPSPVKIETCFWIASKLITGAPPEKTGTQLHLIVSMEKQICSYLEYRLHMSTSQSIFSFLPPV